MSQTRSGKMYSLASTSLLTKCGRKQKGSRSKKVNGQTRTEGENSGSNRQSISMLQVNRTCLRFPETNASQQTANVSTQSQTLFSKTKVLAFIMVVAYFLPGLALLLPQLFGFQAVSKPAYPELKFAFEFDDQLSLSQEFIPTILNIPEPDNHGSTLKADIIELCNKAMHVVKRTYHKSPINFASLDIGTYVVYPDTQSFSFKSLRRLFSPMGPSRALEGNMLPENCWPFSSRGGKLSFRMPVSITPTKLIIYHPKASNENPPTSISLLAHIPSDKNKKGVWKPIASGDLHWQASSETFLYAEMTISETETQASHYRLMAYLEQDTSSEAHFGCVYKIDLQGELLTDEILFDGQF